MTAVSTVASTVASEKVAPAKAKVAAKPSLQIQVIQTIEAFDAIQTTWDRVYEADRYAQVFISWSWLRGQLLIQPTQNLFILAAYDVENNLPVGFLPLRWNNPNRIAFPLERHLSMIGNPNSDYTGLLCLPEYEDCVIPAFADYLLTQPNWHVLQMRDVLDPRCEILANHLEASSTCDVYQYRGALCPYVTLPNSWEDYLNQQIGTKQRKKLRKAVKYLETKEEGMTISHTTPATFEQDFADFLKVYQLRWGKCSQQQITQMRTVARWGVEKGIVRMYIFRQESVPVAGEYFIFDAKNRTTGDYQGGYDPEFSKFSPGQGAMAYVLRGAIAEGLVMFDFLRGDEGYKSKFGTQDRWTQHTLIARSSRSRWIRKVCFSILGGR
jgi:CelD/BcsL family acetyltransferase involved in cellulose biosynthesis